jgi:hypothetical protein
MMPGAYSLRVYRGDTTVWNFTLWADAEKTIPIDLTNMLVAAEIRTSTGAEPATPLALVVTLPNQIMATLSPAASRPLPASARWDLQLTEPANGRVSTILAGTVSVSGDITESDASLRIVPAHDVGYSGRVAG